MALPASPSDRLASEPTGPATPAAPSFWVTAGVLLLFLAGLSYAFVNLPPHDLWWQMRAGRIIAEEGRIPTLDRFSHTAKGEPWLVQEWLAGLIFYRLQQSFGMDGLAWLKFALIGVAVIGVAAAGTTRGAPLL
ncbi:MAG: hypothetical protein KY468_08685, partial [Armatimonadetes bacterium]|nr:hypothetical protein [Armatimonadota bacterium]